MNITLSVFFNGTSHAHTTEEGWAPLAVALSKQITQTDQQQIKQFDGVGITHGLSGTLFGTGIDQHCEEVIQKIEELINAGHTVTLNAYGHSRGGISALMLAKQLSNISPDKLTINLALHDPVPGNLITTGLVDPFHISLTQKTMDLRACKPLQKVLTLYPHEPLPWFICHAPLFVQYPKETEVQTEVIPGCHSGAQFQMIQEHRSFEEDLVQTISFVNSESIISFYRMRSFLKECGTQFNELPKLYYNYKRLDDNHEIDHNVLCQAYDIANRNYSGKTTRFGHSTTGQYIQTKEAAPFFNLAHQRLKNEAADKSQVRVTVEESGRWLHPTVNFLLKGIVISLSCAGLLFFTTGIGAIPALAIGIAITALCYSPAGQWGVNRFFYPQFKMRNMDDSLNAAQELEPHTIG